MQATLFDLRPPGRGQHPNSKAAYRAKIASFRGRKAEIIEAIRTHGPGTDRQIMGWCGYRDMNAVRPRISEMVNWDEVLKEIGSAIEGEMTNRVVDVVAW